jgi:hypothetical protein
MREDYLWDRSGPVDPEVERLEQMLAPLRLGARPAPPQQRPWRAMTAAAAVVLAALAIPQWGSKAPGPPTGWAISRVDGSARVGNAAAGVALPLRAGDAVRTAASSELTLEDDDVGRLDLGPESEMRAVGSRLRLARGRLHAFIWAPPRKFVVDTPSSRAVDLGCEYTLDVDRNGDGLLRVSTGWVAFQFDGRESFIPADARCATRRRAGPGLPYFEDAPAALTQAVAAFDRGDRTAVARVLATARERDGLTLWHLMTRVGPAERGAVYDRFAELVGAPAEVTRAGVVAGDAKMIDRCWDALKLENTGWWRGWERPWSEEKR